MNATREIERFRRLVNQIADDLLQLYENISQEIDASDAEIVEAQRMFVLDEGFQKKVLNLIAEEFLSAEIAAQKVLQNIAHQFKNTKSELFRQRANDFYDLARYFRNQTLDKSGFQDKFNEDTIIIVPELFPSSILACRNTRVKGILTEQGAPTSHAAILAKSLNIPVLILPAERMDELRNSQFVILDGLEGKIILNPTAETHDLYERKLKNFWLVSNPDKNISGRPAFTADGTPVRIFANIERIDELDSLPLQDVDGIGLFRTEFLFMEQHSDFPSVKQQIEWYGQVVTSMKNKPVTIRILDIGGDKFLQYFALGRQDNPYLGLRGNRVFRFHPELLEMQLRAILEVAKLGQVKILYPMVNTPEDIEFFNDVFKNVRKNYDSQVEVGIMVETPASVFLIRDLIREVDFVSIGTNDLVQYTLTVDRNNQNVMRYYNPATPVIFRMLHQVTRAAEEFGKEVTICGEIASDPVWTPMLIGLGIRNLSIIPNSVYPIKQKIRSLNVNDCNNLISMILKTHYEKKVKILLKHFAEKTNIKENL